MKDLCEDFNKKIDVLSTEIKQAKASLYNYFLMSEYPYVIKESKHSYPGINNFVKLEKFKYLEFIYNFKIFIAHCYNAKTQIKDESIAFNNLFQLKPLDGSKKNSELTFDEVMNRLAQQDIRNAIEKCASFVNEIKITETKYYKQEKTEIDKCITYLKQFFTDHLIEFPTKNESLNNRDCLLYEVLRPFIDKESKSDLTGCCFTAENFTNIHNIIDYIGTIFNEDLNEIKKGNNNYIIFLPRIKIEKDKKKYSLLCNTQGINIEKKYEPVLDNITKWNNSIKFENLRSFVFFYHVQQEEMSRNKKTKAFNELLERAGRNNSFELIKWLAFPQTYRGLKEIVEEISTHQNPKQIHLRPEERIAFYRGLARKIKEVHQIKETTLSEILISFKKLNKIQKDQLIEEYRLNWAKNHESIISSKSIYNTLSDISINEKTRKTSSLYNKWKEIKV